MDCSSWTWCDALEACTMAAAFVFGIKGAYSALAQWRSDKLKDLTMQFDQDIICSKVNSTDEQNGLGEWFSKQVEDEESEKKIRASLRFLSYVCYMYIHKLISKDELKLFEGTLGNVLSQQAIREYIRGDDGTAFTFLVKYGDKIDAFAADRSQVSGATGILEEETTVKDEIRDADITAPTAIIKINQKYHAGMTHKEIYDVAHGWWRVNEVNARKVTLVLFVANGVVVSAYKVNDWRRHNDSRRMAFDGEFDEAAFNKFDGRSVKHLFTKGAANPIRYFNVNNEQGAREFPVQQHRFSR